MKKNKKEIEGRPTKELKIDESLLDDEQKEELHRHPFPISAFIIVGVISLLMIACIVVIIILNR